MFAQSPETNINPRKHPNLAAAQRYCLQAFQRISDAQQANEWDMNGHAQRAKDLLDQASHELKEAADAGNLCGLLLDIGGHRDLCRQRVERGSNRRDVGSGVEPALTQDGIQLILLLFAHQQSSSQALTLRPFGA